MPTPIVDNPIPSTLTDEQTPPNPTIEESPISPHPRRQLFRTVAAIGAISSLIFLGYFTVQIRSGQLKSLSQVIVPLLPSPLAQPLFPNLSPSPLAAQPTPVAQPSTKPDLIVPMNTQITAQAWFMKDRQLAALDEQNQLVVLSSELKIGDVAYTTESTMIAFIAGVTERTGDNYAHFKPNSVYLRTQTGTLTKVMDFPYQAEPNNEYALQLRDINFSDDGKMLAITVSDGLFIYDLSTNTLKEIFRKPIAGNNPAQVFAYLRPVFSPDKNKLLITRGFYEGSAPSIVDLTQSPPTITDHNLVAYVGGTYLNSWADNASLYGYEKDAGTEGNVAFYVMDALDPSQRKLIKQQAAYGYPTIGITDKTAYYLTTSEPTQEMPQGETQFFQVNLENGESSLLLSQAITRENADFTGFVLLPGTQNALFVKFIGDNSIFELRQLTQNLPLLNTFGDLDFGY